MSQQGEFMKYYIILSAFLLLPHHSLLHAESEEISDVLELSGDFTVNIKHEEHDIKLFVSPVIGSARILNPKIAEKLEIKAGWIGGKHFIGPVKLLASSRRIKVDYANGRKKDRFFWFDRPASNSFDGIIAPSALPYKMVRYNFHAKSDNEKTYTLPIKKLSGFGLKGGYGIFLYQDKEVKIGFDLDRNETLVNAPTANLLASAAGGVLAGDTQESLIRFGVNRPVQLMKLSKPVPIAGRPLSQMLVRISDGGNAQNIISEEEQNIDEDEAVIEGNEIIVTGKSDKKREYRMTLGSDFIKGCSSITYDMGALELIMSCAAPNIINQ